MLCSLQRTNPRLTGNIKIVVSDDKLYMESIDSTRELQRTKYKGITYNSDYTYAQNLRKFVSNFTNIEDFYDVTNESEIKPSSNLADQYQQRYGYGCYSAVSNLIKNRFRFFAPLYLTEESVHNNLPHSFVIYRVPVIESDLASAIKSGILVKYIDLRKTLPLLTKEFQDSFIRARFDTGFEANGINVQSGVYDRDTDATILSLLANERTITEFENFVTNSFRRGRLAYSNILNLEFAFDTDVNADFERYVGFYAYENNATVEQISTELPILKLIRTETGIKQYTGQPITVFDKLVKSATSTSIGNTVAPQIDITVNFNPKIGDKFELHYAGNTELSIMFDSTIIRSARSETVANLVERINTELTLNITVSAFVTGTNTFRIRSNSSSIAFENIQAVMPATFVVSGIKHSSEQYNNTFYGGSRRTITLTQYTPITVADKIKIGTAFYAIDRIVEYAGTYLYRVSNTINIQETKIRSVSLYKTNTDQPIICSVLDHYTMDFDRTQSKYANVLSFDTEQFRTYLLNIVSSDSYRGNLSEDATDVQIEEYKTEVTSQINKYFDNLQIEEQYLLKSIDIVNFEAETTDNEYNRLNETELSGIRDVNRLYGFINKWQIKNGTDVHYNPYRLNIGLPFRYDNFSPSTTSIDRDIRYHTHDWLISAEGQNPYIPMTESNIAKHLSYSRLPIELDDLHNTESDAFDLLTYNTEIQSHSAFSTLRYDESYNTVRAFFRGLMIEFPDISLDGYRFAAVLKTRYPTPDDELQTRFIRNDVFKTLTLFVEFYIPDPILTRLEQSNDNYYLDRSLLYFSNEIYSTTDETVDFGISPISLDLYNTTSTKTLYNNQSVARETWFLENSQGRHVYVGRGDRTRFRSIFTDIIRLEETFEVFFLTTDEDTGLEVGLTYVFENIREVTEDYFWCENIVLKYTSIVNDELNTETINVIDLLQSDPNAFQTNNLLFSSQSIAYEHISYRRATRAQVNIARYRNLSTASVVNVLKQPVTTDRVIIDRSVPTITTEQQTCRIIEPATIQTVIKLQIDNKQLQTIPNPYSLSMLRYFGEYEPVLNVLSVFKDTELDDTIFKRSVFNIVLNENRYRRITTNNQTDQISTVYVDNYNHDLLTTKFEYSSMILPWLSNPSEYRSLTSLVLNSSNNLQSTVTVAQNGTIDLVQAFKNISERLCAFDKFSLSSTERQRILSIYTDSVSETSGNFDFNLIIIRQFVLNTLLRLYDIDTVRIDSERVQFSFDRTTVFISSEYANRNATVQLKRKSS